MIIPILWYIDGCGVISNNRSYHRATFRDTKYQSNYFRQIPQRLKPWPWENSPLEIKNTVATVSTSRPPHVWIITNKSNIGLVSKMSGCEEDFTNEILPINHFPYLRHKHFSLGGTCVCFYCLNPSYPVFGSQSFQ